MTRQRMVRLDEAVIAHILAHAHELEKAAGRRVSFTDALADLLGIRAH